METIATNGAKVDTRATGAAVLETALQRGDRHVGDLVWWSLREVKIPRAVFAAELHRLGFEEHTPSDPGAWSKITRAAAMAQAGKKGILVRSLGRRDDVSSVAIVRETVDHEAATLQYGQTSRVHASRKTGLLTLEHPGEAVSEALREAFDTITANVLTDDLRPVIVSILGSMRAVSLRDGGGVFFVRAEHSAKVRALQALVQAHGSSRIAIFRICESDADELAQVKSGVTDAIQSRTGTLIEQIERWIRETEGHRNGLQRRSLDVHVRELGDLENEVTFYADMLGDVADEMRARARAAREALDALLWSESA